MTNYFVFSIDTCVSGDANANPMDETNVAYAYESCPLSLFLAIVRGVGKLCNYGRAVNESAVTVIRVHWDNRRPHTCFVETHLSSVALSWVEMLHAGLPPSHGLVRMFDACKCDIHSISSQLQSRNVESWPPQNIHTKTVAAMMRASVLTLTRDQKRRLWFSVERKEAYVMLWMLKSAEENAGASRLVYTEYRALESHLRNSHQDIAKFVDDKTKERVAAHCEETQAIGGKLSPVRDATPHGAQMRTPRRHMHLSEAKLAKKEEDRETKTTTSSESESSCSACSSPRIEPEAAAPPPAKQIPHQSGFFYQDLLNIRNCNFPTRAKTADRAPVDTDWTSGKVHQLGLIWDPAFIDGGFVLKPHNFPAHFKVGMKGWVSIW